VRGRLSITGALAILALAMTGISATSASFTRTVASTSSLTAASDFRALNTVTPQVTGAVSLASTLTRQPGTWSNSNVTPTYAYQWQYCPAGVGCVDIPGAVGATYQITLLSLQPVLGIVGALPADAQFRVVETATNPWGSRSAGSVPVA
jgi:hypothetical protein